MFNQSDLRLPCTTITVEQANNFDKLPNELVIKIMLELDPESLGNLSITCHRMHSIFDSSAIKRGKNKLWPMLREQFANNPALREAMQTFLVCEPKKCLTLLNRIFGRQTTHSATNYFITSCINVPLNSMANLMTKYPQLSVPGMPSSAIGSYVSQLPDIQTKIFCQFLKNLIVFTNQDVIFDNSNQQSFVDISPYMPEERYQRDGECGIKLLLSFMLLCSITGPILIKLGAAHTISPGFIALGSVMTAPGLALIAALLVFLFNDGRQAYKSFRLQQRHQQLFEYFCNKLGIGKIETTDENTPLL